MPIDGGEGRGEPGDGAAGVGLIDELVAVIEEYLCVHNDDPKSFVWTAAVESILAKVRRERVDLQ